MGQWGSKEDIEFVASVGKGFFGEVYWLFEIFRPFQPHVFFFGLLVSPELSFEHSFICEVVL